MSPRPNRSPEGGASPAEGKDSPVGLAIDTTFDDTSVAVLRGHREVLANVTLSQYADHAEFGGVVPERASRRHLEAIHPLIARALAEAGALPPAALDYVAVSNLPGLLGAILVGMTVAKSLAYLLDVPLIGINHIEAHPYANILAHGEPDFPALHLVAAGGHTVLIHQRDHFDWEIVGRSVDDAAGECVDKVAKLFGHPMPGGPVVDRMALAHPPGAHAFPRPKLHDGSNDFSFSGLKTAMLYFLRERGALHQDGGEGAPGSANHGSANHGSGRMGSARRVGPLDDEGPILAAFFAAVSEVLVTKTLRAARKLGVGTVTLSGGLAASGKLRGDFREACEKEGLALRVPPPEWCTDNAAMVACLASYRFAVGRFDDLTLEGYPNLPM